MVEINLPSTIGIANLGLIDLVDGEFPHVILALDRHNGGVRALGDDHGPLSLLILLGQVGNVTGDLTHVLGVERVGVGIRSGLGLVADQVVPVGGGLIERVLEELRDEGGAEAQGEDLVVGGGLLGQGEDRGHAHGQMVAADKIERGLLDECPDVGRLEVLDFVLVGGGQMRAHAAIVARDDDAAAAGGGVRVYAVFYTKAGGLAR